MAVGRFISKNLVALVMVPLVVGAHYGWYKLQDIDALVSEDEKNKLPIAKALKNLSLTND